ncbi:hypothetical protein BKA69DRAFT_784289 [Paraphysoderma sedebokerense]|nr:hypothetical protein BKA69DRAFT_784289 [Paraphysoderma sedebokerense]
MWILPEQNYFYNDFATIFGFIGGILNCLLLIRFYQRRKELNVCQMTLVNICLADCLEGFSGFLILGAHRISPELPDAWCQGIGTLCILCGSVSGATAMYMSVERYLKIVRMKSITMNFCYYNIYKVALKVGFKWGSSNIGSGFSQSGQNKMTCASREALVKQLELTRNLAIVSCAYFIGYSGLAAKFVYEIVSANTVPTMLDFLAAISNEIMWSANAILIFLLHPNFKVNLARSSENLVPRY